MLNILMIEVSAAKHPLEAKLGGKPTTLEVYEYVYKHREKDGTEKDFCDNKSKRVKADYVANVTEKYESDVSSQPSFNTNAWIEAVGEQTKGRLYGIGTLEDPNSLGCDASYSASSRYVHGSSSCAIDDEQLKNIEECIREDVLKGLEAWIEECKKAQVAKLIAEFLERGVVQTTGNHIFYTRRR